jgi:iron complex outermembrane receptor protein
MVRAWQGMAVLACVFSGTPGTVSAAAAATETDALGRIVELRIGAQSLATALIEFSQQSGVQVMASAGLVRGLQTQGVQGQMSVAAALDALLQGTRLNVHPAGPNTVSLRRPEAVNTPTAAANTEEMLEFIVVTATKTEASVTETSQSLSVVTREEMELRGVQDLNGALSYSSGIKFRDYPGGQGMQDFYLRGFRSNNTAGSVFRDGLRQQFNGLDGDLETYGLERIELLKGPSSVLYGQGAPGGLVNAITKRPTKTALRELVVQGGSHDRLQGAADFSGPIDADAEWRYRMTALGRESDTQFDYVEDNRIYAAPALTWAPSERTELTLLTQYLKTEGSGGEQSFPVVGTVRPNPNGQIPANRFLGDPSWNLFEVEGEAAAYEFKHRFTDSLRFNQVLRYSESDTRLKAVSPTASGNLTNNRLQSRLGVDRVADSKQLTTDANLAWSLHGDAIENTVLVGIDYAWHRRNNVQRNGTIAAIDVFAPVYDMPIVWAPTLAINQTSSLDQTGIYLQDQVKWQGLSITGGLRRDEVRTENLVRNLNVRQVVEDDKITGRVGAIYETALGLAPYASYSTSFQPLPGTSFGGRPFEPTEGKQIEVGVKYQIDPGSLLTLAVYELTQTNVSTPDPAHAGFFVQQGEVRSRGVELEGRTKVTEALNLIAAYAYTDAETTKANPAANGISTVGLKQLGIPEHNISLWADYTFALGADHTLDLGAGARYVTDTYNTDNSVRVDGYTLVDLAGHYTWRGYALSVNVSNLLDKEYFTPGFYNGTVFYGYGRTVLATLRYRW